MPRRARLEMTPTQVPYNQLGFNQPTFHGSRHLSEDLTYDDVHPSTVYPTEVILAENQVNNFVCFKLLNIFIYVKRLLMHTDDLFAN